MWPCFRAGELIRSSSAITFNSGSVICFVTVCQVAVWGSVHVLPKLYTVRKALNTYFRVNRASGPKDFEIISCYVLACQEQTKSANSRVSVWTITGKRKRSHFPYRSRHPLRCVVHMLIPQPAVQPLFTAVLYSSTVTGLCSWEESEVGRPHTRLRSGLPNMSRGIVWVLLPKALGMRHSGICIWTAHLEAIQLL